MANRTRREFFSTAAKLSGAALAARLLEPVSRASAIAPAPGTTYLDAEHVVILMQENRSFDHAFGSLRGVRGFNDPRAVTLPNGNPAWLQSNAAGEAYAPFRLDIKGTKATWLGSLPHSWSDQTDARNHGNHDKWLDAKPSGRKECAGMPFTMGYYDRRDLPFYYALADAFTICDQNFCSSLTGTTPNRLYFWSGTVRNTAFTKANVWNSDVDFDATVNWPTFPERLEEAGVSWKIYQNEITLPSGFQGEEDAWLGNFSDNPIEWFDAYHVRFSKTFREYAKKAVVTLPAEIAAIGDDPKRQRERRSKERELKWMIDAANYTDAAWAKLSQRERNLHEKAFTTNSGDASYRELTKLAYRDGSTQREMQVPKGDALYQFRKDVEQGKLPKVSWLVPSERFSDHPGSPWYGAWMVSETMRILTANPEVWKKTIFVLTYDENDGYFDHVPPFVAPDPSRPETGKVSAGIDVATEYWPLERDREGKSAKDARGGSIGLGYRVPMLVASPWSRGGFVNSQVFDHTSVLQLLENVTKTRETNISAWRRAVCGDMSSVFQPAATAAPAMKYPARDEVLASIHQAQFKGMPGGFQKTHTARQEPGVRPSLPLPYDLHANGKLSADRRSLDIVLEARRGAGSPFHAYTPGKSGTRAYAVAAGARVDDSWELEGGAYHLCVHGPNGFLRVFAGTADDPQIEAHCEYLPTGDLQVVVENRDTSKTHRVIVGKIWAMMKPRAHASITVPLATSHSWYDVTLKVEGADRYSRQFAGRVETGKAGFSDPAMGNARG